MTPKEILERIEQLEKELASLKERVNIEPPQKAENLEPKFDVPELDQEYFLVYANGSTDNLYWGNSVSDYARLVHGNIILTEQEALKTAIYNKLRAKYVAYIKEYNGDWVADWSDKEQVKYYLQWDCFYNSLDIVNTYTNLPTDSDFIFKDYNFLSFIQKRMTDAEIRAVINHDLSCIEVENE